MVNAMPRLKNGRNDYVFNIPDTARTGLLTGRGPSAGITPVAQPTAPRPGQPAWVDSSALLTAGFLLVLALLAYLPALNGGFLWDDDAHVTKAALRSLPGLARIWTDLGATQQYYPVLHSAFWAEHRLWGDAVLGYHLVNVVLHSASAWLLYLGLRRLGFAAPLLAALLFLLHPVCVESVAWIAEQKNTLSAVLYLGAALAYLGFDETRKPRLYAAASLLFGAALLTKSVTATLPAALLLVAYWRRGRLDADRDLRPLVPWLGAGVACGLFTAWVERTYIGASGAGFELNALQRVLLSGRVICFYIGKLLWPRNLLFIYPRWVIDPGNPGDYAFVAGVVAVLCVLFWIGRRHRGPLTGALFFVGTLFPALGFVNVYPFLFSYVADHFQYLACLGVLVPAAWAVDYAAGAWIAGGTARRMATMAVPVVLAALTYRQSGHYADADTLNRDTLARNPDAWLAHYNLAVSLGSRPDGLPEAIAHYETVIRLNPGHWAAHGNLGTAYLRVPGRIDDAVAQFREEVRLNPDGPEGHNNLGLALGHVPGASAEAEAELRTALRLRPDYADAHLNLGEWMRRTGRPEAALGEFAAAVRAAPTVPEYRFALANVLAGTPGRLAEAIEAYRQAVRLRPDYMEAHSNLGAALGRAGLQAEALGEYRIAARLAPADARVHANLAHALARKPGGTDEALREYAASLRIDPQDAQTHNDFGVLLSDLPGRLGDAITEFRTAVQLSPGFAEAHYCLGIGLLRAGGARGDAATEFRAALRLRPDFDAARRALAAAQARVP